MLVDFQNFCNNFGIGWGGKRKHIMQSEPCLGLATITTEHRQMPLQAFGSKIHKGHHHNNQLYCTQKHWQRINEDHRVGANTCKRSQQEAHRPFHYTWHDKTCSNIMHINSLPKPCSNTLSKNFNNPNWASASKLPQHIGHNNPWLLPLHNR